MDFRIRQWRHRMSSLSMTSLSLAGVYCASTLVGRCLCKRVDVYIITISCTWWIYALSQRLLVNWSHHYIISALYTSQLLNECITPVTSYQQNSVSNLKVIKLNSITRMHACMHTHTWPFYSSLDFVRDNPGELVPESTFCHLLDFLVQNEDNTGRHTNSPDGLPPIQTNWCPSLPSPPFLCQMSFLAQPSQFILNWDRHQICWLAYPVACLNSIIC